MVILSLGSVFSNCTMSCLAMISNKKKTVCHPHNRSFSEVCAATKDVRQNKNKETVKGHGSKQRQTPLIRFVIFKLLPETRINVPSFLFHCATFVELPLNI